MKDTAKKVLIVDDLFVDGARKYEGIKPFTEHYTSYAEDATPFSHRRKNRALQTYSQETRSDFHDITKPYHDAGGKKNIELLVLGEPTIGIAPAPSLSLDEKRDLAYSIFNTEKATKTIEEIDLDVLILDIGFYAPVSDEFIEEFIIRRADKRKSKFSLSPKCRNGGIDFPCNYGYEILFSYGSGSLQSKGGIALAYELEKRGRDFSFWTSNLHHAGEGISFAHTMDLLSDDEVKQVIASDDTNYQEILKRLKDEPKSRTPVPPAKSDNGKIIVKEKNFWERDWEVDGSYKIHANSEFVPVFDQVISIAETTKKKEKN